MALLDRPQIAALTQFNLIIIVTASLLWFGLFTFQLFYILIFLGLLVTVHVFAPVGKEPQWYVLLRWLSRLGFLGLGYILYQRVVMVLGP